MKGNIRKKILIILGTLICLLSSFGILLIISNKTVNKKNNKKLPMANISYSIKELTNQDVKVKLINANTRIKIINNNGKNTYTFTKNGEFTFKYIDKNGNKGETTAKVDWIDKEAPTAEIIYDILESTNKNVVASIDKVSEDIKIINNDGNRTYTFTKNGEFTFEIQDLAGNTNKIEAKVDWIDREKPFATVNFETNERTITAKLSDPTEPITILNNNGKDTYIFYKDGEFEFQYQDLAGNVNTTVAKVTGIKKLKKKNKKKEENVKKEETKIEDIPLYIEAEEETKKPTPREEKFELPDKKIEKINPQKTITNSQKIILVIDSILVLFLTNIIRKRITK